VGPLEARGRRFALASPHALATAAGAEAVREGGTAVDAALAAAAVLAVVYPHMCSVGGDLVALLRRPDGSLLSVNGTGAAPEAFGSRPPATGGWPPHTGPGTVTVPGAVAGWATLRELGGRLPWRRLLEPAVALAANGAPVARSLARDLEAHRDLLRAAPGLRAVFAPRGRPLREGERLVQPALAATLLRLAEEGPTALYGGDVGRALVDGLRPLGCPLDLEDLRRHRTEVTAPLGARFRGWDLWTAPPNSQGFVLLEVLGAAERLGVGPDPLGPGASLLVALAELASRDRDSFLADPRFSPVPLERLLSPAHLEELAEGARLRAGATARPGPSGQGAAGTPGVRPSGDTVAVVAADADGSLVSLLQSVFHSFGSGVLEPATGILLHNRGAAFSPDPASPNAAAPGKRPAHTLMPVLVTRAGRPVGAAGTMGGLAHPQLHVQVLLRVLEGGAGPWAALDAPRWVLGGLELGGPAHVVSVEARAAPELVPRLEAAGYGTALLRDHDEAAGHFQLAWVQDGELVAAADPRSDGAAAAG
jgi:gamma-glutamyltranspeptidase